MNSRRFNDPIAFDPLPARAGLQDIELARISQEVKKRFYQGLGLQPRNRAFIHLIGRYQKHWLARAEEARILANQMTDAEAKVAMLRIAEDYERLAQRAEGRALGRHELAAPCMSGKQHSEGRRGFGHDRLPVATGSPQALRILNRE
jgi:hypothetical protein